MNPRVLTAALLLLASLAQAESFTAWAARGTRQEKEKDDKAAYESYSNALSSWKPSDGRPGKARVLCARAALREKKGDGAGALQDYGACLTLEPRNSRALDRRGNLLVRAGKLSSAIDDYYKAIALDIRFAAAYADRARAYELQGDRQFAAEDYRRACELNVPAACEKARGLSPSSKHVFVPKRAPVKPAPKTAPKPAPAAAARAPAAPKPAPKPLPKPKAVVKKPKPRPAADEPYLPTYADCRSSLQACSDRGAAFSDCVARAPACEHKAVRGCCPEVCIADFRAALNNGASEAAAYRNVFSPKASCAGAPLVDKR